jgi:hypothetical protein
LVAQLEHVTILISQSVQVEPESKECVERESADRQYVDSCSCEKLVAKAGDISGTQRKGNVRRWKPLPSSSAKTMTEKAILCVIVIYKM